MIIISCIIRNTKDFVIKCLHGQHLPFVKFLIIAFSINRYHYANNCKNIYELKLFPEL